MEREEALPNQERLSVLLLCDDDPTHASTLLEHIDALRRLSRHRVQTLNPRGRDRFRFLDLDAFDAVVIHYSLFLPSEVYIPLELREKLREYDGLKVQFVQDDYRRVDDMCAAMREVGIDVLFTLVPERELANVWSEERLPGVEKITTLAGYVSEAALRHPSPPLEARPLDVGYRGRTLPYWLGTLGQEKVWIAQEFAKRSRGTDLRCDIGWRESDRIYGMSWFDFVASCRVTLGTESGSTITDFDGSLEERGEEYLREHPSADFWEVHRALLEPYEGNVMMNIVSPRIFEAIALRTGLVLFPGEYSGVIEPEKHYIPLAKDFSNFDEVVERIRDLDALREMVERAHRDVVASGRYSYSRLAEQFDAALDAKARARGRSDFGRARRRLVALEQHRASALRRRWPVAASLRARSLERTGRDLIRRFPAIEALAVRAETAGAGRAVERELHDLVRLAAATAAHLRELRYTGPPFDVRLELDEQARKLMLVSTPDPTQPESERLELRDRVAAAIREERLEEVVWNHRAVGLALTFPAGLARPTHLEIGHYVVSGVHRLTTLSDLVRTDPAGLTAALEPLFRARPDEPVHELGELRRHKALRILRASTSLGVRGVALARAVLGRRDLRRLLLAYLGNADARAGAPLDLLLKDFFRLRLVEQAPTTAELSADGTRLLYRTCPDSSASTGLSLDPVTVRTLEQIVWDNSGVGTIVTWRNRPRVPVMLDDGVYAFRALTAVARCFPELAAPALERSARS